MSDRRRLLMAIANQFKWLPYYYEYLYHDLVPTTIDSKNVQNKAKVATIYGNSVVENQLFTNLISTQEVNGITFTNNGDGSITISGTATAQFADFPIANTYLIPLKANHIYLAKKPYINGKLTSRVASASGYDDIWTQTSTTADSRNLYISIPNGTQINSYTFTPQLIDLTQMFPFDAPTTLTDNRVQAILNRGYIPYNTGEIKSVDVGEIESGPYNLCDGIFKQGSPTGSQDDRISSLNNIEVLGGISYTLEANLPSKVGVRTIIQYDKDLNQLSSTLLSNTNTVELKQNTRYIKIQFNARSGETLAPSEVSDVCFHRTGTRTGYAPYVAPQIIQLKYQGPGVGTAHDTMEIGKENVVFTKRIGTVDLGSLNYNINNQSQGCFWTPALQGKMASVNASSMGNLLSNKYQNIAKYGSPNMYDWVLDKVMCGDSKNLIIRDTDFINKTTSEVSTSLSGVPLRYELATPQVITIPRKHLGVVDLGSLNWNTDTQGGKTVFKVYLSGGLGSQEAGGIANIYCSKYVSTSLNGLVSNDKQIRAFYVSSSNPCQLGVYDSDYTSATDFKSAMAGIYLYYETQDEVADMLDKIDVQAGGTLTSNWFSWNENQLLVNGDFSDGTTGWNINNPSMATVDTTNNQIMFTVTTQNDGHWSASCYFSSNTTTNVLNFYANHKYLAIVEAYTEKSGQIGFYYGGGYDTYQTLEVNKWQLVCTLRTQSADVLNDPAQITPFFVSGMEVGKKYGFRNFRIIDLTLGFGAGKEPTSISDPRIQYILSKGYIQTNTTGTNVSVDPNVLPNVTFNMKCK